MHPALEAASKLFDTAVDPEDDDLFDNIPEVDAFDKSEGRLIARWNRKGRHPVAYQYSWALLDDRALRTIAEHSPIISVGAGTGYYEDILTREYSCDVKATDFSPPTLVKNTHANAVSHFDVQQDDATTSARAHPERALLIIWPTMYDGWADRAIRAYRKAGGKTFIYVGEGECGCCADEAFFKRLRAEWDLTRLQLIPQWPGNHDMLAIYTAKDITPDAPVLPILL